MIVVMENSFHGRIAAPSAQPATARYRPVSNHWCRVFIRVLYGDLAALQAVADNQQDVVAVLVEPIQGGRRQCPSRGLPAGVRALCDSKDWLMILDEIQTGMGAPASLSRTSTTISNRT